MRQILFKAKRMDTGEWVEGYYQKRKDVFENDEHLIFRCESYHTWEYIEIDPETICQYTGLTDKNGNKIWENDVVEYVAEGCVYKCIWNQYNCEYQFDNKNESFGMGYAPIHEYEVIGNIFDNPELLENEQMERMV